MKLEAAIYQVVNSTKVISRPYMLKDRHCYLVYQGLNLPFKLHNTITKLRIDWHPSVDELWADDWFAELPELLDPPRDED